MNILKSTNRFFKKYSDLCHRRKSELKRQIQSFWRSIKGANTPLVKGKRTSYPRSLHWNYEGGNEALNGAMYYTIGNAARDQRAAHRRRNSRGKK